MTSKKTVFYAAAIILTLLLAPMSLLAGTEDDADTDYEDLSLCKPISPQFYHDRNRGWFAHEYCEKQKEKHEKRKLQDKPLAKEKQLDWAKLQDPKYLDTLSSKEFRDLLKRVQEETVYRPDKEKVLAMLRMQDYMKNKSLQFSYFWRDILLDHPELDPTTKNPTSSFASYHYTSILRDENKQLLVQMADDTGLFFFVEGDCPYCHAEAEVINLIRRDYGIAVNTISNDHCNHPKYQTCSVDPSLFQHFDIKQTPALVAVLKDKDDKPHFQPIAYGLTTMEEIINRLVFYFKYSRTGQYPGFKEGE